METGFFYGKKINVRGKKEFFIRKKLFLLKLWTALHVTHNQFLGRRNRTRYRISRQNVSQSEPKNNIIFDIDNKDIFSAPHV